MRRLLKKHKNKVGISVLSMVVGVMMAFVAIGGLADLTILQTKFSALSTQTGYVSRVVSAQGGIQSQRINNFHGRYVTSQELYRNISSAMNHAGISDDEWEVMVGGYVLTPSTHVPTVDYGERLSIRVTIDYGWPFTSNFMPGNMRNTRTSTTEVITTHRIRDGGWSE